jgi:hypothetical protein
MALFISIVVVTVAVVGVVTVLFYSASPSTKVNVLCKGHFSLGPSR